MSYYQITPGAHVDFDKLFDYPTASSFFELIPEIDATYPNRSVVVPFGTGCFHSPDGVSRVYFFEETLVFYPDGFTGNVERVEFRSDGSVSSEEYDHRNNAPWQSELEACLNRELSGELAPGPPPPPNVMSGLLVAVKASCLFYGFS